MTNPTRGYFLGFDYGIKSIGVACGQAISAEARPLAALKARDGIPNWDEIKKYLDEWEVVACVVGLPLNMDGTEQELTLRAKKFSRRLEGRFALPVHLVDERLTTVEAKAQLFEEGGYASLDKALIDSWSAKIILEQWFANSQ